MQGYRPTLKHVLLSYQPLVVNHCKVLQILHANQKTFSSDIPMNPLKF
jgi:hypothetical protein